MDIRLGLIGCGRLAERAYLLAIERARGVRLAALADVDLARCRALAPDLPSFASAAALVQASDVDAVIVTTPAAQHVADAEVASRAGLPALVEKPPASTAAEARRLAGLDPAPCLGFNRRFDPSVSALRARVPPTGALALDLRISIRPATWRAHVVDDDALLDLGPHLVDLALWLTGARPQRVAASVEPARASLALDLDAGRGHARIKCMHDQQFAERFEIRDAEGVPIAIHRAGGFGRNVLSALRRAPVGEPLVEPLTLQLEAFARVVRGASEPDLATARDGLQVMAVLDSARRSAAAGGASEPLELV